MIKKGKREGTDHIPPKHGPWVPDRSFLRVIESRAARTQMLPRENKIKSFSIFYFFEFSPPVCWRVIHFFFFFPVCFSDGRMTFAPREVLPLSFDTRYQGRSSLGRPGKKKSRRMSR